MKRIATIETIAATLTFIAGAAAFTSIKEGLVEHIGAQKNIFATGKADPVVSVPAMAKDATSYAVAAAAGLDGEITIFAGKRYVTKVRGTDSSWAMGLVIQRPLPSGHSRRAGRTSRYRPTSRTTLTCKDL